MKSLFNADDLQIGTNIYTIGHSNLEVADFITLLHAYRIEAVVDVRSYPSSKRFPHFNRPDLAQTLTDNNIAYQWLGKELGGHRKGGYENVMQTNNFQHGLKQLLALASQFRTAIMCAEKLYTHCHRQFIADALIQNDWSVVHIVDKEMKYCHNTLRLF